jgi:hypothetical protein
MNKHEAHDLLNKRKQGLAVAQHLVDHALVVCGDIGPSCFNGKNSRLEGSGMAQSQGTGVMPYGSVEWAKNGFSQQNERTQ